MARVRRIPVRFFVFTTAVLFAQEDLGLNLTGLAKPICTEAIRVSTTYVITQLLQPQHVHLEDVL